MFKVKPNKRDKTGALGTKDVEIIVPLIYSSNFCIIFHMSIITCIVNLIVSCSADCVISTAANQATTFVITDTKLYVLVLTLSFQANAKLLQQLK